MLSTFLRPTLPLQHLDLPGKGRVPRWHTHDHVEWRSRQPGSERNSRHGEPPLLPCTRCLGASDVLAMAPLLAACGS